MRDHECASCGCALLGPNGQQLVSFASATPAEEAGDGQKLFCRACRDERLGPPCRGCGLPAPRSSSVLAGNSVWHADCFRCAEPGCGPLGLEYHEHDGELLCTEHFVLRNAPPCARCEGPVAGGGVSALGRAWHRECFVCSDSGKPLGVGMLGPPSPSRPLAPPFSFAPATMPDRSSSGCSPDAGPFQVREGLPVAHGARQTPLCAECGEPADSDRLYAMGRFHHVACFVCVHCKARIGGRRFVVHDGEPYLESCFQKVFGEPAPHAPSSHEGAGERRHYAGMVPLSLDKLGGSAGLAAFSAQHQRLLPAARRALRDQIGFYDLHAFLLTSNASRPGLVLTLSCRDHVDARAELQAALGELAPCREWGALLTSVYDTTSSRGQPWWGSLALELQPAEPAEARREP